MKLVGSGKCNKNCCQFCKNVEETDTFQSFVEKKFYKINHIFTCSVICLVYLSFYLHVFYYIFQWMKTLLLTVSSFVSALYCLIVFLFCQHFCLLSHFEIIKCFVKSVVTTSTYFLLKYIWKKGCPNKYAGPPDTLSTSVI